MRDHIKWFLVLAAINFACWFIYYLCFINIGKKISYELKRRYLRAILMQEPEWFDKRTVEEIPTEVNTNIAIVEESSGKTIASIVYCLSIFFWSLGVCFYSGPVLACCFLGTIPYTWTVGGYQEYLLQRAIKDEEIAYSKSGTDAEEALNAIKIVKAFGQENQELDKFESHLKASERTTKSYAWYYGISFGLTESLTYFLSAVFLLLGGFFITEQVGLNINSWVNLSLILGTQWYYR